MVFNPFPSLAPSCKLSRVLLCLYLSFHACGCISFSIRPPSYYHLHLIFCVLSLLPLFVVIQLFRLWQREHDGRQEIEARVFRTEESLQRFMAETTFSSKLAQVYRRQQQEEEEVEEEEEEEEKKELHTDDDDDRKRNLRRRPECAICFEEMGDTKLGRGLLKLCQGLPRCWKPTSRNRALLIPCGHASICTSCALKLWKSSSRNRCPICRVKLTKRPKRLPAVIHT
jgi:rubrerythrin